MNELTERLTVDQPIIMGGANPTAQELRERTGEMGYVLVKFTETRGGTELGFPLDILFGLVELAYDTRNQPTVRFIEPLAYESPAYTEARQSVQLSRETGVERPFILSTPRLTAPDVLELPIPFRHEGLAELFRARTQPTTAARLREALELNDEQAAQLGGLLTPAPDLSPDRHVTSGARIRYFGHACLVLQTPQAAIMTDPWVSADITAPGRYTYGDLPDHIDLVLITHGHQDHIVLETLLALRDRVGAVVVPRSSRGNLADPSLALYLSHAGLPVVEVDDFSEVAFPGGLVTATPFLGGHADLDIRAKSTYCVRIGGRTVFIGADSSGIDPGLPVHALARWPDRHRVPRHGVRRRPADLALPGPFHRAGVEEDE